MTENSTATAADRQRLDRLAGKLTPSSTALIVVDVQNDFCSPGGVMDLEGADLTPILSMLPRLGELLKAARGAGVTVVHVRNAYNTPDGRYLSDSFLDVATRRLKGRALIDLPMCEPGKWGADHPEGYGPRDDEPVVTKHRYSGFHQTDLELVLRTREIRTVVTAGVATNVCVETTARDAFMRDFHVVFPSDAAATYYEAAHTATLATIGMHFGEVATVDEIIGAWQSARSGSAPRSTADTAG